MLSSGWMAGVASVMAVALSRHLERVDRIDIGVLHSLKLINGERFTPLRRRLLYDPGSGASHEIVVEAAGVDENDHAKAVRATVADPERQTHLTAVGAWVQLEHLLGLDDAPPPAPGIVYPDTAPHVASALRVLRSSGVTVTPD